MRILGFSKKWDKLKQKEFTTFRFPRRDKDWFIGEQVQIVYKPRTRGREILGIAEITDSDPKYLCIITDYEAKQDGFKNWREMLDWMMKRYEFKKLRESKMNKLTLRWIDEN